MMQYLLLSLHLFLMLDPSTRLMPHAIYLSFTEIDISDTKAEIRIKVFSDDLRDALKNFEADNYKSGSLEHFFQSNTELATRYFNKNLMLEWNEQSSMLTFKSYKIESDAHFITFEYKLAKTFTSGTIQADFFMELFPTQVNVVQVSNGKEKRYLKFEKSSEELIISFEN